LAVTTFGSPVSLVAAVGCGAAGDGCAAMTIRGFTRVTAFTPTYDREIASRAAMPIPTDLSFRPSQNCGCASTSADLRGVTGTFGAGMTFGVTKAGFSTGAGLTAGFAAAFFSSRVLATFGDTTGTGLSGSLTIFCFSSCIGAAGTTFARASAD
jgi:hypothetical protein